MQGSQEDSTANFVRLIKREIDNGFGFTPFVGSGISAQSGILMSKEFSNYLAYSVWKTLGSPEIRKPDDISQKSSRSKLPDSPEPWNIISEGWPPYPTSEEVRKTRSYFTHLFRSLGSRYGYVAEESSDKETIEKIHPEPKEKKAQENPHFEKNPHFERPLIPPVIRDWELGNTEEELHRARQIFRIPDQPWDINLSPSSKSYIEDVALRALFHWTSTLEFLARTRVDSNHGTPQLRLSEIDGSVIDSFNQHITRGKHPNLIHNMLSRLSRSLRTHVILTTNFDTLLEQAFGAQGEPLYSVPVSSHGSLPPQSTVRAQDCLVKLHGDLLETRADSSINAPPKDLDKQRFFEYLRGPVPPYGKRLSDFVPSHLLVIGYSASDARCVQMMKYALDFDSKLKIFWVCHTPNDRLQAERIFADYVETGSIQTVVTARTDLLLWELYQAVNLSLPGGGYSFKFSHHIPPVRFQDIALQESDREKISSIKEARGALFKKVKKITEQSILCVDHRSGIAGPFRMLFADFAEDSYQTLWMELEDHRNTIAFLWEILGAISLRKGFFQAESVNFLPHEILDSIELPAGNVLPEKRQAILSAIRKKIQMFCARYRISPENWVLFLYGRNGPGGCAGWEISYWSDEEHDFFLQLLEILCELGFRIIYLPHGSDRHRRNLAKIDFLKNRYVSALSFPREHAEWQHRFYQKVFDRLADKELLCPLSIPAFKAGHQSSGGRFVSVHAKSQSGAAGAVKESEPDIIDLIDQINDADKAQGPDTTYEEMMPRIMEEFLDVKGTGQLDAPIRSVRMVWLYGLTLFRQSRNSAAMISEAVFPCPWRFNSGTKDNDKSRYARVFGGVLAGTEEELRVDDADQEGWCNWLERNGLFLKKPGGFSWKYRDTRLGIQYLLEGTGPLRVYHEPFRSDAQPTDYYAIRGLWHLRARIHYWIADWYSRAFHSTGHYNPLVESIFHCSQAILLAEHYEPPQDGGNGILSARIQLAWTSVCLLRKALKDGRHCLHYWCPGVNIKAMFLDQVELLHEAVGRILAQDKTIHPSPLAARLLDTLKPGGLLEKEIDELAESVFAEGFPHRDKPAPILAEAVRPDRSEIPKPARIELDPADGLWWPAVCEMIYSNFELPSPLGAPMGNENPIKEVHRLVGQLRFDWLSRWDQAGADDQALFRLTWSLSRTIYHIVRRAKLVYHASPSQAIQVDLWRAVCVLSFHSLQLSRLLPPDHESEHRDLRVRILSVYGLALGCLGRVSEGNRRFNEAHALSLARPGGAQSLHLARLHLRRAEMFLYQVRNCLRDPFPFPFVHIDDAWAAIERAESALSGRNHSSFWWYRVAVTKLSCFSALATVCDIRGISPHASLPLRRRQHLDSVIESLLLDALIASDGDRFRELRAADYAIHAARLPELRKSPDFSSPQTATSTQPQNTFLAKKVQTAAAGSPAPGGSSISSDNRLFLRLLEILAVEDSGPRLKAYCSRIRSSYGLS